MIPYAGPEWKSWLKEVREDMSSFSALRIGVPGGVAPSQAQDNIPEWEEQTGAVSGPCLFTPCAERLSDRVLRHAAPGKSRRRCLPAPRRQKRDNRDGTENEG